MSLPTNQTFTGQHGQPLPGPHPQGTFLFQGTQMSMGRKSGGGWGLMVLALNVYGKTHGGTQVFCVERVLTNPDEQVTQTHTWKTEAEYTAEHMGLWRQFDMEPNRDFNVGAALRSVGGEHLGGSSELCERDGSLKLANIRARC